VCARPPLSSAPLSRLSPRSCAPVLALVSALFALLSAVPVCARSGARVRPFLRSLARFLRSSEPHLPVPLRVFMGARPCTHQRRDRVPNGRSLAPFLRSSVPHPLMRLLASHLCTSISALHLGELFSPAHLCSSAQHLCAFVPASTPMCLRVLCTRPVPACAHRRCACAPPRARMHP
jgi:hypothetical protein